MPQMAPMSWLILFLMFTACLITMNTINYYLYTPKMDQDSTGEKKITKTMSWK
uniref:ATP synthase complex subunit 8 n=1 Tax=Pseudagrion palauense TaxID=218370 RepID=Q85SB6_9ODON|nr:ATP synthase F0 subunit 8 [Pseudagrion palauense]